MRFLLLAILLASPAAMAHRRSLDAGLTGGAGGLNEQFVHGQYSLSRESPIYVSAELGRGVFAERPRDDLLRYGGEAGYEGVHFGLAARFSVLSGEAQKLTATTYGITFMYRFVPFEFMQRRDEILLYRDDRIAKEEGIKNRLRDSLPPAVLLSASFDTILLDTPGSAFAGGIAANRFSLWMRFKPQNFWMAYPSAAFYVYGNSPSDDAGGARAYGSRALRLVRLGPWGQHSGIFGSPSNVQQLYLEFKVVPLLGLNVALTRASLELPGEAGYSFYAAFNRYLDSDKRWAISPGYEHYLYRGEAHSYVTVSLRLGAAETYLPHLE